MLNNYCFLFNQHLFNSFIINKLIIIVYDTTYGGFVPGLNKTENETFNRTIRVVIVKLCRNRVESLSMIASTSGEGSMDQRDIGSAQRTERDRDEKQNLEKLKAKELKARLVSLGLKTTGRKTELRARLQAVMQNNDTSSEEEGDDEDENEDDKKDVRECKRSTQEMHQDCDDCYQKTCVGSTLSFKDVEDALESFSSDRSENVERWFESFEQIADMCMWSEGQKAIYAKRLLKGSAKIFASFECHARTWHELKKGLIKKFSKKINSRQVQQRLRETKKRSDEACLAYMFRMLEIASLVDMELWINNVARKPKCRQAQQRILGTSIE